LAEAVSIEHLAFMRVSWGEFKNTIIHNHIKKNALAQGWPHYLAREVSQRSGTKQKSHPFGWLFLLAPIAGVG
jgi:hypothetical protein